MGFLQTFKMGYNYRNNSTVSQGPRRRFDRERLEREMKLVGEFGLKNKREIWRCQLTLAKIRSAARVLMTLDDKDARRIFEGAALLRRLTKLGLLTDDEQELDFV